jgi:hypothetical protein
MNMVPKHVAAWLRSVVAAAPRDGLHGSERVLWFNAFGYTSADFGPEHFGLSRLNVSPAAAAGS